MVATFLIVLPIFGLILAGWLARWFSLLGPQATRELNQFVVYLALPALLFDIVAHARWEELWQPGFIGAFGLSIAVMFLITLLWRLRRGAQLADAAIDGLNAAYGNTGFMGFPLALAAIGKGAMAPTLVATILTACVVFAGAVTLIEIGLQSERRPLALAKKVGAALARNPLLLAPATAALIPWAGATVPGPAESFLKLLGGAASPCALIVLGMFLASKQAVSSQSRKLVVALVLVKLVAHPAMAWVLAAKVFALPAFLTHTAVFLAALPTGTGPFMLAEFYRREAAVTSQVVLWSTTVSVVTVSVYLASVG